MKVRVNAVAIANLLIGLQDGCNTMLDLADMTGLTIQTVRHYCNLFHRKGIVHICDWNEDVKGGRTLKVFALGTGKDMPKPKPLTTAQICARYRARQKHVEMIQRTAA